MESSDDLMLAGHDEAQADEEIKKLPALEAVGQAALERMDAAQAVLTDAQAKETDLALVNKALQGKAASISIQLHNLNLDNCLEINATLDSANLEGLASRYTKCFEVYNQINRAISLNSEVLTPEARIKRCEAAVEFFAWRSTVLTNQAEVSHIKGIELMLPAIKAQGRMSLSLGQATLDLRKAATAAEADLTSARATLRAVEQEYENLRAGRGANLPASAPRQQHISVS